MRAPLLLLGAISVAAAASDPGVFDDYFDDQLRSVDIPQESALKACLSNGDATGKKIQTAYDDCFGTDYDFNDLAENEEGKDSDGDDLPDEYEANEACFYTAMGWVSANGKDVSLEALEADMAGLEEAVAKDFKANAKSCSKWSGDFGGGRRKREAGEEEVVPDLMASGRRSLGWVKSMARKTRSAEKEKKKEGKKTGEGKGKKGKGTGKGKGKGTKKAGQRKVKKSKGKGEGKGKKKAKGGKVKKGNGKGDKGSGRQNKEAGKVKNGKGGKGKNKGEGKLKKGNGKGAGRTNKGGKGKKGKGGNGTSRKKKGEKVKKGKGKGKETGTKNGKGKNKKGNGRKKDEKKEKGKKGGNGGNGGNKGGKGGKIGTKKEGDKKRNGKGEKEKPMDEKIYNKLWCFDLAIEQALEKCVEDKIKN